MTNAAPKQETSKPLSRESDVKRDLNNERKQIASTISKQAASTRLHLTGRFKMQ